MYERRAPLEEGGWGTWIQKYTHAGAVTTQDAGYRTGMGDMEAPTLVFSGVNSTKESPLRQQRAHLKNGCITMAQNISSPEVRSYMRDGIKPMQPPETAYPGIGIGKQELTQRTSRTQCPGIVVGPMNRTNEQITPDGMDQATKTSHTYTKIPSPGVATEPYL